ncbi:DUF6571 family protein [Streptomyces qinglanensis]|uniref:DUF6571 domain-containing protein n=1 Tax=Streptomyces qinglanensis TaxID=943816 RepID=A0A1H9NG43_9ACTN|nr:DUF6571 family protein [Streptomyces qinglanensis]SER34954.1 hypothetical protein SAMN05421870_101371 [Streptomyces qinglanensis]
MALTYQEAMKGDLSVLVETAEDWKEMGKKFGTLRKNYKTHVRGVLDTDSWSGVSATMWDLTSTTTLHELIGAENQAKAVGGLLVEAHAELSRLKKKVKEARDDAVDAKMKVDENGFCEYDLSKVHGKKKKALIRDHIARQEAERAWTQKIADAVKNLSDADHNYKLAIKAAAKDRDGKGESGGFNSKAVGDVDKYSGIRAAELGKKMDSEKKLSSGEMSELQFLLRENSGDTDFSRTMLNSLGADRTISLANELNDRAYSDDTEHKGRYLKMEKYLANSVATATTIDKKRPSADKKFVADFREKLRKAGVKQYDLKVVADGTVAGPAKQRARGYQSFVTLLQHGKGYDKEFLHGLADDIRAAEDPKQDGDPDIWDLNRPFSGEKNEKTGTFSHDSTDWFANDPLDGTLGIMSKDPDIATSYLDPKDADGKSRLHYLAHERDWKIQNDFQHLKDDVIVPAGDKEPADSRVGYGAALEAAMTGHVPGTEPPSSFEASDAQRRVFANVVNSYAEEAKVHQDAMPENIRRNLAQAVAYHPKDVADLLSQRGHTYAAAPGGDSIDSAAMTHFIRAAGQDGQAFRIIHDSQMDQVAGRIHELNHHDLTAETQRGDRAIQDSGKIMGTLDKIRADVLTDERDTKVDRNTWGQLYAYHGISSGVSRIPMLGPELDRVTFLTTREISENMNDDIKDKTREELIENYENDGYPRLAKIIEKRADDLGIAREDFHGEKARGSTLLSNAHSNYVTGLGGAEAAMGD